MTVKTRFAPSPTGSLHVGGARTALYNWLWARHTHGKFILRIEDTDQERSTETSTQVILDAMKWLNLNYDEGPYYQHERLAHYREIAESLIERGLAYRCYCTKERLEALRAEQLSKKLKPRYDGHCRDAVHSPAPDAPFVIRFKNPTSGAVEFDDKILGHLSFKNEELDDLIIIRSDGYPTYNFSVVIDDYEMGVTEVIRGGDHVNNTPRQINLLRALGYPVPIYAHVPMIVGPDGKRFSKRHGATSVLEYQRSGYLPEALLNYLVRLGWAHGDQEVFSIEEMVQHFEVSAIHKAAAMFDPAKLIWLNRHYLKTLPQAEIAQRVTPFLEQLGLTAAQLAGHDPSLEALVAAFRERADTLQELAAKMQPYYAEFPPVQPKALSYLTSEQLPILEQLLSELASLSPAKWQEGPLHEWINTLSEKQGRKLKDIAQPLRAAITGDTVSPPLNTTLAILGKERTLARLKHALQEIGAAN